MRLGYILQPERFKLPVTPESTVSDDTVIHCKCGVAAFCNLHNDKGGGLEFNHRWPPLELSFSNQKVGFPNRESVELSAFPKSCLELKLAFESLDQFQDLFRHLRHSFLLILQRIA